MVWYSTTDLRLLQGGQKGIERDRQEGKEIGRGTGRQEGIEIGRGMIVIVVIGTETEKIGKGAEIENDIAREVGNMKTRGIGKETIGIVVDRLLVLVTLLPYEEEMEIRKKQDKIISSMARNRSSGRRVY